MSRATFSCISVEAAGELLARENILVLDVRDAAAYALGRIGSARRVSDANLYEVITSTPKASPVLIYCYHGNASQVYAQTFTDFGFREVYSMDGGFERWCEMMAAAGEPGSSGNVPAP
jgi:thiosulfate/3-mercaptopyruvate sulfurtransferase